MKMTAEQWENNFKGFEVTNFEMEIEKEAQRRFQEEQVQHLKEELEAAVQLRLGELRRNTCSGK